MMATAAIRATSEYPASARRLKAFFGPRYCSSTFFT